MKKMIKTKTITMTREIKKQIKIVKVGLGIHLIKLKWRVRIKNIVNLLD